jgi:di/tricarboxylate transporter
LNIVIFSHPDILIENIMPKNASLEADKFLGIMIVVQIVVLLAMCAIIWAYYRIIYGILLKKLNRNFKELESMAV